MFRSLLQQACDSGSEVLVTLKDGTGDPFRGRVIAVGKKDFRLFHSGHGGGILWQFRQKDLLYCGLVLDVPSLEDVPLSLEVPETPEHSTE